MKPKDEPKGTFINEGDLGPELTEDNCTPELWDELTSDDEKPSEDDPDRE